MISRDRAIVVAAGLPSVVAFGLAIAITHDLIISGMIGGAACVVSAAVSLSPPVQRARLRLLRRKYPAAEQVRFGSNAAIGGEPKTTFVTDAQSSSRQRRFGVVSRS